MRSEQRIEEFENDAIVESHHDLPEKRSRSGFLEWAGGKMMHYLDTYDKVRYGSFSITEEER